MSTAYRICHEEFGGPDQFGIRIEQRGENGLFRVTYGLQVKANLTYEQAAREFGYYMFHALACKSMLGNDGK